jgi:hypothetical protein
MQTKSWKQKAVEEFINMFKESVIIQAFMAATVTGVIAYMTLTGQGDMLSKEFWVMSGAIYGYYFKSKNDNQLRQQAKEMISAAEGRHHKE